MAAAPDSCCYHGASNWCNTFILASNGSRLTDDGGCVDRLSRRENRHQPAEDMLALPDDLARYGNHTAMEKDHAACSTDNFFLPERAQPQGFPVLCLRERDA